MVLFYSRVLKKEKLKQELKEFEELQKKDPEEALKKLESIEKARALERHTLRHKSTGKWAKNKLIRAKYDKEVKKSLVLCFYSIVYVICHDLVVYRHIFYKVKVLF